MLLAFDTATHAVTVALHSGTSDGHVVAESTVVDALRHGELLAPGIQRVLAEAGARPRDITRIAVGVGPGPFTGLRVGIVTARTMAAVLEVPVVGVCTLDVVAAAVSEQPGGFRVATDARRKEVYWAAYDGTGRRTTAPAVDRPGEVSFEGPVAGRGALLYPDAFPHAIEPEHPSASDLARVVAEHRVDPLPPEPLYLRRPDVATPGQRKRVL
jgi:tRNA threonylcarbamoyl adenosine modification protein YeaZ